MSLSDRSQFLSFIIFITPIESLLSANGSCDPVGISPIANSPTIVSILSAIARIEPMVVSGSISPANLGRYCSKIA